MRDDHNSCLVLGATHVFTPLHSNVVNSERIKEREVNTRNKCCFADFGTNGDTTPDRQRSSIRCLLVMKKALGEKSGYVPRQALGQNGGALSATGDEDLAFALGLAVSFG
jgi:hypothetical protein